LKNNEITNTEVLYDVNLSFRVSHKIPKVDAIVSVYMLSNLQKERNVLKQLNQRLKKGDRIVFMENDKFFDMVSNVEWISDYKKLKKVFSEAGFDVKIDEREGYAWKYIFISGTKMRNV